MAEWIEALKGLPIGIAGMVVIAGFSLLVIKLIVADRSRMADLLEKNTNTVTELATLMKMFITTKLSKDGD